MRTEYDWVMFAKDRVDVSIAGMCFVVNANLALTLSIELLCDMAKNCRYKEKNLIAFKMPPRLENLNFVGRAIKGHPIISESTFSNFLDIHIAL